MRVQLVEHCAGLVDTTPEFAPDFPGIAVEGLKLFPELVEQPVSFEADFQFSEVKILCGEGRARAPCT